MVSLRCRRIENDQDDPSTPTNPGLPSFRDTEGNFSIVSIGKGYKA
jgi:hypothetical protein